MAVPSQVLFDREMDPLGVFGDRVGARELHLFMDITPHSEHGGTGQQQRNR